MWQAEVDKARAEPSVDAQAHTELGKLDPGREKLLRLCHTHSGSMNSPKEDGPALSHLDRKKPWTSKAHTNSPLFPTDDPPNHLPLVCPQNCYYTTLIIETVFQRAESGTPLAISLKKLAPPPRR